MSTHDYEGGREFIAIDREIWLEPNTEPDGGVSAAFCWGHCLRQAAVPAIAIPTIHAILPSGKRRCLKPSADAARFALDERGRETGIYRFICEKAGCYSLDAEGNYANGSFRENPSAVSATRYFQYAEAVLRVGGAGTGGPFREPYLFPLRLECERLTGFHVGQILWGRLWFALNPLPLYDLTVSRRLPTGEVFTDELITDGAGYLTLPLTQTGDYLITAQGKRRRPPSTVISIQAIPILFGFMLSRRRRESLLFIPLGGLREGAGFSILKFMDCVFSRPLRTFGFARAGFLGGNGHAA